MALELNTVFDPRHGEAVEVAQGVLRVTAPNPSPFTFHGTNSYIVGTRSLAVIDPGPADDWHLAALLRAVAGRPVSHVLVSHTHRDHSPLARALAERTGATGACPPKDPTARRVRSGSARRIGSTRPTTWTFVRTMRWSIKR